MLRPFAVATAALAGLVAGSLSAQEPPAPAPDRTVIGLELGAPFTVPECPKSRVAGRIQYEIRITELCFKRARGDEAQINAIRNGKVDLDWPRGEVPTFIASAGASVRVIDGTLAGISYFTLGLPVRETTREALVSKYGAPHAELPLVRSNLAGASVEFFALAWRFQDLSVEYHELDLGFDRGLVEVVTDAGALQRKAEMDALNRSRRPPETR